MKLAAVLLSSAALFAQTPQHATSSNFQYEAPHCTRVNDDSVLCSFRITNLGPARLLMHQCAGETRARDLFKKESPGQACTAPQQFANQTSTIASAMFRG